MRKLPSWLVTVTPFSVVLTLVVLSLVFIGSYFFGRSLQSAEIIPQPAVQTAPVTLYEDLANRMLFSKLEWTKVPSSEYELQKHPLTWTNNKLYQDSRFGEIALPGTEWVARKVVDVQKDLTLTEFDRYYQLYFEKNSWVGTYDTSGITIQAIAASGGVPGEVRGAFTVSNGVLRAIAYSYIGKPNPEANVPDTMPPDYNYPMEYEFRVFVSNPVALSTILPTLQ